MGDFFTNTSQAQIKKNAPEAMPGTGKKSDLFNYMLKKAAKGRGRPYENVEFDAAIAYSTYMTKEDLEQKYDPSFVEYIVKSSATNYRSSKRIVEAIVYIREISGCLPRPDESFLHTLKSLHPPESPKKAANGLKTSSKKGNNSKALLAIEQIKRWPRVYAVLDSTDRPSIPDSNVGKIVRVRFPYSYDYSIGVIL